MVDRNSKRKRARDVNWQQEHRARMRELVLLRRQDLQDQFFEMYGQKCACPGCNETNRVFLTLDHVQNDGYKVRHKYGSNRKYGNWNTYQEAIKEYRPDLYQVLCFNCNCGKNRNGGVCPHLGINTKRLERSVRRAKFTEEQVKEIRKLYKHCSHTFGCSALAKRYGVCRQTIEDIVLNVSWNNITSEN